ncbi:MAG: twitching motility protein PilT [Verrucomicrobiae bacterium]|nr:twitching motility protein PilT [Verrucomicrobiae bacterium]
MDRTLLLFRVLFLTCCGAAGWYLAQTEHLWHAEPWLGAFLGLALGLMVILADLLLKGVSLRAFSSATFGFLLGLILAWLIKASGLFEYAADDVQWIIHLSIFLIFGYLGMMLALRSNRDEFCLIIPYVRFMRREPHEYNTLLDTSSIIDGRISDLCKSGFLEDTLVVPHFVLDELQALADCPDATKRARGRHGLDILNQLRDAPEAELKVHETPESEDPVDTRLINLARVLDARIATTDYNLARIAELQRVRVLNINQLANSLRPPLITGDRLRLKLVREGKDADQAVGFLPDGAMVVVNQARRLIGQEVDVVVSGNIQTSAGRMLFAELQGFPAKGGGR